MLQQFSWQHFLVATLVLTLAWYVLVILIFYRKEFLAFLGQPKPGAVAGRLPHRWEGKVDDLESSEELAETELMGTSKLPEGMHSLSSDALLFSGGIAGNEKQEQIGLVPDVLEELKVVFARLSAQDGNKRDFMEMMEAVRGKFPKLAGSPNIGRINGFITDHAPFHLSKSELEDIWG